MMGSDQGSISRLKSFSERVKERYANLTLLGQGGMGVTFRGFDTKLGREVAIKVVQQDFSKDSRILERFRREVLLLSRIQHANIVTIYDMAFEASPPYFTMEYIEGESLGNVLETKLLTEKECLTLAHKLGESLEAVHSAGVLHRDIKPQNIMISLSGEPVLIDFGLATGTANVDLTALTRTGNVVGTTCYIAPELLRGEKATIQSDIYQIGVCMYEAVVGHPPFDSQSLISIALGARAKLAEPPSSLGIEVSRAFDELVIHLLSPIAKERPSSAKKLSFLCEKILTEPSPQRPSPPPLSTAPSPSRATSRATATATATAPPNTELHASKSKRYLTFLASSLCLFVLALSALHHFQQTPKAPLPTHKQTLEETMDEIKTLLSGSAKATKEERLALLENAAREMVPLCRALSEEHPRPAMKSVKECYELFYELGKLSQGEPSLFASLTKQTKTIKSLTLALRACSLLKPGHYQSAFESAQSGLEQFRKELLESSISDWSTLENDLAYVVLVQNIGSLGRERGKAKLLGQQLLADAHAFRARYAAKMGKIWIPVKDEVALIVKAIGWQCREADSFRILSDARYPLQLIVNSPDLSKEQQERFKKELALAFIDYPRVKALVTSNDDDLEAEYWSLVGKHISKGEIRYRKFRENRYKQPELWYPFLGQSYWCYRLGTLGPEIEPNTRGSLLNVCKDLIIYGSRMDSNNLALFHAPPYIAHVGVTQLSLLTKSLWGDEKLSIEIELNALVSGYRLFKAMSGRLPGAGRPLGPNNSQGLQRFGDWRKNNDGQNGRSAWSRALKLLEKGKGKALSQRVLLAVHRRISGDFPSAMIAYEQMLPTIEDLVRGNSVNDYDKVNFFRHLVTVISEETDSMGDVTNLRKYVKLLERFLSSLPQARTMEKGSNIRSLVRLIRALKRVNKARLTTPKLTTDDEAELKDILSNGGLAEFHDECHRLLARTKN